MRKRRSIRKFTAEPISQKDRKLLMEALLRSPTSRNFKPLEFVLVDDPMLLATLSTAKPHGAAFLKEAALAVVICADETKSDVWVEDCSIAAILLQMTAQSLGLGSCWVQLRLRNHDERTTSEQFVQKTLHLSETLRVGMMIAIGHPAEKREPLPASELDHGKMHMNSYGQNSR